MTRLPPRLRAARAGLAALGVGVLIGPLAAAPPPSAPIPVKVVVVTMYQNGALDGDQPGEAHLWVGGVTNSSTSIMALGLDPRFDLRKAYWLIAGIAGGDPLDVSLGTAAWAKHVVDGDLLYEVDAREIPADWPYGMLPLGAKKPNDVDQRLDGGYDSLRTQCPAGRVGLFDHQGSSHCR